MKRLLKMLIILSFFYMLLQLAFKYLGNGHKITYEIKGNDYIVKVTEIATYNRKKETDNYYFTFDVNQKEFAFQTSKTFKKNDYVVKKVEYLKTDNYECIYPVFKNKEHVTDILCMNNDVIYNYHDLRGRSAELDKFAKDMEVNGYDATHWYDNTQKVDKDLNGPIVVYSNNVVKGHYLGVDNYDGIYLINNYLDSKSLYRITVLNDDAYERTIEGQSGRYYVMANYNSKYDFNEFYIVDLVYNDKNTIKYHSPISFNSYIQGSVDGALYLFDRNSKKQYKIDARAKTVVEVGNEATGIKYYNLGKQEIRKAVDAVTTNLYFNDYKIDTPAWYSRIDKVGNELSGYYYYYKQVGSQYEVYRASVQSMDKIMYLFNTTNINEIQYVEDYIYYKEGNTIKYYHDRTGVRTLIYNSEFAFNKSLQYYTYLNK